MKGHFEGKLRLLYIDGRIWQVINPDDEELFSFILDDGRSVTPPDGMLTDFASIPRGVWNVLPPCGNGPDGKYGLGAVIHDLLYATGKINGKEITQQEADDVLKACCEAEKVAEWMTHIIHDALVVGGFVTWNNYRNGSKTHE
jgi:hypothetical protein